MQITKRFHQVARAAIALCGVAAAFGAGLAVDPSRREEARTFFNSVYSASEDAEIGYTGDVQNGIAGTTDAGYREKVRLRVNWFRAMAGVPAGISFSDALHAKCQQGALMMSANDQLSHNPPAGWTFYTAGGAEAASNSNLFLGAHGPEAITGYIEDPGAENAPLGHRRWIFYPQTQTMGTGDVPAQGSARAANVLWVFDANYGTTRPAVRDEFVAWPPPGYVPYTVVFPRWSFSYPNADFSNATVTLTRNGKSLGKSIEPITSGYGEDTISWIPADRTLSVPVLAPPTQDVVTTVTVSGVKIGAQTRSFTYSVRVFDPSIPGTDTTLADIDGPELATVGFPAAFKCAAVPRATGYDWEVATLAPLTVVEGAEDGLSHVILKTSGSYNVISTLRSSGASGFHLANPDFRQQSIELDRVIVPSGGSELHWKSRLGWASAGQTARVQVSLDEGLTWQDLYSQQGSGSSGEGSFVSRSSALGAYAGRPIRVRFLFDHRKGSSAFLSTDNGVGWHLDDIRFSSADELKDRQLASDHGSVSLGLTPSDAVILALRVRPVFFGKFRGEWAAVKRVDATTPAASLTVNIIPPGAGTVTGAPLGTSAQQAGAELKLTAKSAPGFLFQQWTGAVSGSGRTLGFLMPSNLVVAANFIRSPWPAARGKYSGLVVQSPDSSADAGRLTVVLDASGAFSGSLVIGGKARSFTGRFDARGKATFGHAHSAELQIPDPAPGRTLALSVDPAASPITAISASISASGRTPLSVTARRSLLSGADAPVAPLRSPPAAWIGPYTARLSATGGGPRGDGWARIRILRNGVATLTGKLADGKPIVASGKVREDGVWELYRSLYNRRGALAGEVTLEDLPASDVAGSLRWFRPSGSGGRYSSGWPAGLVTEFSGSRYHPPLAAARVLSALDPVGGAAMVVIDTGATATWPVIIGVDGQIRPGGGVADGPLRGEVDRQTGAWMGTLINPADGLRVGYRGVVLQKEGIFAGYFLTPAGDGRVRLSP